MDIRKLLDALAPEDKEVWQRCRTELRKAYINAHNIIHGVERWENADDAFLDLIDIKIATLFDRNGRLAAIERIIPPADKIEKDIEKAVEGIGNKIDNLKKINEIIEGAAHAPSISDTDKMKAIEQWGRKPN